MKSFIILFVFALSSLVIAEEVADTPSPWFKCEVHDRLYTHPCDCTKFFHCRGGEAFLRQCDNPLVFSQDIQQCEWKGLESPTCFEDDWENCQRFEKSEYFPKQNSKQVERNTEEPITESPWFDKCVGQHDTYYAHPCDCNRFFHCANGKAWEGKCDDGLEWDAHEVHCNWPQLANCVESGWPGGCPSKSSPLVQMLTA